MGYLRRKWGKVRAIPSQNYQSETVTVLVTLIEEGNLVSQIEAQQLESLIKEVSTDVKQLYSQTQKARLEGKPHQSAERLFQQGKISERTRQVAYILSFQIPSFWEKILPFLDKRPSEEEFFKNLEGLLKEFNLPGPIPKTKTFPRSAPAPT